MKILKNLVFYYVSHLIALEIVFWTLSLFWNLKHQYCFFCFKYLCKFYLISGFPVIIVLSRPDLVLTGAPQPGLPNFKASYKDIELKRLWALLQVIFHAKMAIPKVIMQGKLFQWGAHLLYCSVLQSLGDKENTRRMSKPGMGSIFYIKNQWNILVIGN